jgi:hypothetical protein
VPVTETGTPVVIQDSSTSEWSQSITIPTDANLITIHASGARYDGTTPAITELNFTGSTDVVDFTRIGTAIYIGNNDPLHEAFYMSADDAAWPGTGTHTLYGRVPVVDEGWTYIVVFWSGADAADPINNSVIVDTDFDVRSENPKDFVLSSAPAGSISVVGGYTFSGEIDANPSGEGQTAVSENAAFNSAGSAVGKEAGESTLWLGSTNSEDPYLSGVAFVINEGDTTTTIDGTASETVVASDEPAATATLEAAASETASLNDTPARGVYLSANASDTVAGSDEPNSRVVTDESVFGTEGEADSTLDLSVDYDGPFTEIQGAGSITLEADDVTVTISHASAVHESAIFESDTHRITVWNSTAEPTVIAHPIAIGTHYLEDANGDTLIMNGGAAWSVFVGTDESEATLYLSDRASKEVNAVCAKIIEKKFTPNAPTNVYGDNPFRETLGGGEDDFTTPNEVYWKHVDWILREAHRYGITVLAFPAYVGYDHGDEGWAAEIAANGDARMTTYGEWLANRYGEYPNIVWMMGGDWGPTSGSYDLTSEVNSLANGIKGIDTTHKMSAHASRGESARGEYDEAWLDFNTTYTDNVSVISGVEDDYQQTTPTEPTIFFEGYYANEHGMTNRQVRTQGWQAIVSGASGQFYGNAPQWYFGEDNTYPGDSFADTGGLNWKNQLDSLAAPFLTHIWSTISGLDLSTFTPDHDETVLVSGHNPNGAQDDDYAPLMYRADAVFAYMPIGQSVTIDTSLLDQGTWSVTWIDPDTGNETTEQVTVDGSDLTLNPAYSDDNGMVMQLAGNEVAASESAVISDSPSASTIIESAAIDTVAIADSPSASAEFILEASDALSASDAPSESVVFEAAAADSPLFSDVTVGGVGIFLSAADALTVTDAAGAVTEFVASILESVTVTDAGTATAVLRPALNESVSFDEAVSTAREFAGAIAEAITLTDRPSPLSRLPKGKVTMTVVEKAGTITITVRSPDIGISDR